MNSSKNDLSLPLMIREAIKARIKEKDLSIRKCATDNGFNYQDFYRFVTGDRPYPLDKIEKVMEYLDLEIKPKNNNK